LVAPSARQPANWRSAGVETRRVLLRLRQLDLIKHTNDCSSTNAAELRFFIASRAQQPEWLTMVVLLLLAPPNQ
jgi:hypothetical protein